MRIMPKAIANPEEIKRFAQVLVQNMQALRSAKSNVQNHFDRLHSHWQDEKYHRFRDIFLETMHILDGFLNDAEAYVVHLHRKAGWLDEYLKHRY
jgi:hypothetical protein